MQPVLVGVAPLSPYLFWEAEIRRTRYRKSDKNRHRQSVGFLPHAPSPLVDPIRTPAEPFPCFSSLYFIWAACFTLYRSGEPVSREVGQAGRQVVLIPFLGHKSFLFSCQAYMLRLSKETIWGFRDERYFKLGLFVLYDCASCEMSGWICFNKL